MAICLSEGNNQITYNNLFEKINNRDYYIPIYKYDTLINYLINLVVCLVNDMPIKLIDADFSEHELSLLKIEKVNKQIEIKTKSFSDFSKVIDRIKESKSEITLYTSGTTGLPKEIKHDINTLCRFVVESEKHNKDIWGLAYNPTHMAGIQVLFQALLNNNSIINLFGLQRKQIYENIQKFGVTHISATPSFYRLLLPFEKEYRSVKRITFGGEKSDTELYNSIKQIFPVAKFNNIYASTESGSLFVSNSDIFKVPQKLTDKIKFIDNELLIHKTLLGESNELAIENNFYHTGDIIEIINPEEKSFRFVTRKNNLINIGGYNVDPIEIEDTIRLVSSVEDVVVFSKKNSVLGNILCADIKLIKGKDLKENHIRQFLREKLQEFKIPRRIQFTEKIKITRTGKIERK